MEQMNFYRHVSSWISSYRDPDALEWLRRFVNSSQQPIAVKQKLQDEIDRKADHLRNRPAWTLHNGEYYLADDHGHPRVYTTRFSAVCKVAELKLKGYSVELKPGSAFYRIIAHQPAPVGEYAAAS